MGTFDVNSADIENIDELIRQGKGKESRIALTQISASKVPRALWAKLAELYRRSYMPEQGVRLLHPLVRKTAKFPVPASDVEKAEYAACLNRIGSNNEAWELLESLDTEATPQVLLYKSFVLTPQWDYARVIPLLMKYTQLRELDAYQRLIGMVNLADAFVYERKHQEARPLIREILYKTSIRQLNLLHANCLQVAGLNEILERKWIRAREFLNRAEARLKASQLIDAFFVRKWKAILNLMQSDADPESVGEMLKVREEALLRQHWETVRDCDRMIAIATKDSDKFWFVYYGTPYETFRRRLLKDYGKIEAVPKDYLWVLGQPVHSTPVQQMCLDPLREEDLLNDLRPGHLIHRVLKTLCADFYKPVRLATLFFHLYPQEFYHPESSRPKVHEGIRRLRAWIDEKSLPLVIKEQNRMYWLDTSAPFGIRVQTHEERKSTGKYASEIRKLRETWPEDAFSVKQASVVLKLSTRSMRRVLSEGQKQGCLSRIGKGAATKYHFVTQKKSA